MSKSVLVLDTPKNCNSCVLCCGRLYPFCKMNVFRDIEDSDTVPDWCPLKPLPEKVDDEKERKLGDFEPLFKIGWNACIDEITGEP